MKFIEIDLFLSWDKQKVANTELFCYLPVAASVKMDLMKIQITKAKQNITDMKWIADRHVKKTFTR